MMMTIICKYEDIMIMLVILNIVGLMVAISAEAYQQLQDICVHQFAKVGFLQNTELGNVTDMADISV